MCLKGGGHFVSNRDNTDVVNNIDTYSTILNVGVSSLFSYFIYRGRCITTGIPEKVCIDESAKNTGKIRAGYQTEQYLLISIYQGVRERVKICYSLALCKNSLLVKNVLNLAK